MLKNKKTAEKLSDKGVTLVWDLLFNLLTDIGLKILIP